MRLVGYLEELNSKPELTGNYNRVLSNLWWRYLQFKKLENISGKELLKLIADGSMPDSKIILDKVGGSCGKSIEQYLDGKLNPDWLFVN